MCQRAKDRMVATTGTLDLTAVVAAAAVKRACGSDVPPGLDKAIADGRTALGLLDGLKR
jgi:hypothetical protein